MLPGLLLAACAAAQPVGDPARAKQVIDDALRALGGDAFLRMADRVEEGRAYSFYREQLSGLSRAKIYTRYLTRPEPPPPNYVGIRERQAFGKKEDVYIVFNESGGFEITYRGAKPLPPESMKRYADGLSHSILYLLRMRLGEPGLTFEYRRADIYENVPVHVVDILDSDNRITTVYFQQSSRLPVRQVWENRDPVTKRKFEEITVYSKYKDVGAGVMWPLVVRRERDGEKIFEMFADAVAVNQGLTDDLFTIPSDVKILEKGAKRK
jgi:hypothetical protein